MWPVRSESLDRGAQDDVVTRTTIHDVITVQSKHDVVSRAAVENVSAAERLVRDRASLNQGVRLVVVIESDEELGALPAVDQCRLRRVCGAQDEAQQCDQRTGRQCRKTETGTEFQVTHCRFSPLMNSY